MKLEQQVCSLELAKRLKELGVRQESIFHWVPNQGAANTGLKKTVRDDGFALSASLKQPPGMLKINRGYSAFTVAELGEMLREHLDDYNFTFYFNGNWVINIWKEFEIIGLTEADARAKMLVHLIEKGIVKP